MGGITQEQLAMIKMAIQGILRLLGIANAAGDINAMTEDELKAYLTNIEARKAAVDGWLKAQ